MIFDDFITLGHDTEAASLTACIHMFFKLVGWAFAQEGPKAPDFSQLFTALGVTINVSRLNEGLGTVGNADHRREELLQTLDNILTAKRLSKAEALKLRGRLQFAAGNLFGRVAKAALAAVSAHAYGTGSKVLDSRTTLALQLHRKFLESGRPRELRPACDQVWFIQTDACFEPVGEGIFAGIGGVLFSPDGTPVKFLSHKLDAQLLTRLNPGGRKTAIYECEFFALVSALYLWAGWVNSAVVVYTDNNAVRDAMISCHTSNVVARRVLIAALSIESEYYLAPWYARVPTDSNLADDTSRLSIRHLQELGAQQSELNLNDCWDALVTRANKWGDEQVTSASPTEKK